MILWLIRRLNDVVSGNLVWRNLNDKEMVSITDHLWCNKFLHQLSSEGRRGQIVFGTHKLWKINSEAWSELIWCIWGSPQGIIWILHAIFGDCHIYLTFCWMVARDEVFSIRSFPKQLEWRDDLKLVDYLLSCWWVGPTYVYLYLFCIRSLEFLFCFAKEATCQYIIE